MTRNQKRVTRRLSSMDRESERSIRSEEIFGHRDNYDELNNNSISGDPDNYNETTKPTTAYVRKIRRTIHNTYNTYIHIRRNRNVERGTGREEDRNGENGHRDLVDMTE